jgi:2-(1,2-epoxy-1,2-dihydrophenyl)acetyl-CoA isomerase
VDALSGVAAIHDGAIARIELARPEVRNALDVEALEELKHALEAAHRSEDCSVVLLSGTGAGFCSGDDLRDDALFGDPRERRVALLRRLHNEILVALTTAPKPSVAAVQGYAVGFGMDLALACDHRVLTADAKLLDGRIAKGIPAATGVTWLLPALVGQAQAAAVLLGGRVLGIAELRGLGLADEVVPDAEVLPEAADRFARAVAEHGALRARTRQALWRSRELDLRDGVSDGADLA